MKPRFEILFLEEVFKFLDGLDEKTRNKILQNIEKARFYNDITLFKKLNTEIWEFRTVYCRKQYRLFAFWDKTKENQTLVIATHGIIKKTQKTPLKEMNKALLLKKQYFVNKD